MNAARYTISRKLNNWIVERLFPQAPFISFGSDAELGPAIIRSDGDGHIVIELTAGGTVHHVHAYDARVEVRGAGSSVSDSLFYQRTRGRTRRPYVALRSDEESA